MFTTLLTAALSLLGAAVPSGLRAGAHAMDTTPTRFPISMNGGMVDQAAKGAHDRLHARCLLLENNGALLGFVVVDACMIPREVVQNAKRLAQQKVGIAPDHLVISATHTHSAPTLTGVFQSEPVPEYCEFLAGKIAEGLERAKANLQPAEIGSAAVDEPSQVFNRRWLLKPGTIYADPFGNVKDRAKMNPGGDPNIVEPAGPIDPQISLVAVRATKNHRPISVFANYSLHYVGDTGGGGVSADYYGAFAERLTSLLGATRETPEFMAMMSNGTSGDINNENVRQPAKRGPAFTRIRLCADRVAQTTAKAEQAISEWRSDVPLRSQSQELQLAVRKPSAEDVAKAKAILAKRGPGALGTLTEIYARETVLLAQYPDTVPVTIQAARIGDTGVVSIPCEVFVEIGLEIKKNSPFPRTFTISLANGYNGYLPTPHQHSLGGYETWRARSSYLAADSSPRITQAALALLKDLSE